LFIGGLSGGRGLGGWQEWKDKIGVHNYEMTFGEGRVGLGHVFTHRFGAEKFERGTEQRKRAYERQEGAYWAAAIVFLALYLATVWRRGRVNAVLWSMLPVYVLLVPSHYYWSILAFLPLFGVPGGKTWRPSLPATLTALLAPAGWYQNALSQSFQYAQYIRFDWLLGFAFAIVAVFLLVHDLQAMGLVKLPALRPAKSEPAAPPT
jgi:hypothetical protein